MVSIIIKENFACIVVDRGKRVSNCQLHYPMFGRASVDTVAILVIFALIVAPLVLKARLRCGHVLAVFKKIREIFALIAVVLAIADCMIRLAINDDAPKEENINVRLIQ